jgi:hypothetical protein
MRGGTRWATHILRSYSMDVLSWWWSCRWSETTLNRGHQRACCPSPRWYMSMEKYSGVIATGEATWFVYQSSLAILPAVASISEAGETWQRKLWMWPSKYLCLYFEVIFCALKSYDMWPRVSFYLREFSSPLKVRRPRLNLLTLGPMPELFSYLFAQI